MSTCPAINVVGFSEKVSSRSMRFPAKKKMVSLEKNPGNETDQTAAHSKKRKYNREMF